MKNSVMKPDKTQRVPAPWWQVKTGEVVLRVSFWVVTILLANVLAVNLIIGLSSRIRDTRIIDSFNESTLSGIWHRPSSARIVQAALIISSNDRLWMEKWLKDFSLTVLIKYPTAGNVEVYFRESNQGFYLYKIDHKKISLVISRNGKNWELASSPVNLPGGDWNKLHIIVRNNLFAISVNDKEIMKTFDATFASPGRIGFGYTDPGNEVGAFDDLEIVMDQMPENPDAIQRDFTSPF